MINKMFSGWLLWCVSSLISNQIFAQTTNENSVWLAAFYSQKFSDKVGVHFDIQARSDNNININKPQNTLLRPGLTYFISSDKNATAGYLYTSSNLSSSYAREHRIWEQFIYIHRIENLGLTHRFRLEQRFIEKNNETIFAQRLRYFVRGILPLSKKSQDNTFNKGIFTALQNEVFFNIQAQNKLNGYFFNQNRAYIASGYRFNPTFDLEIGYMNQAVKNSQSNSVNNIIQIATYTRF